MAREGVDAPADPDRPPGLDGPDPYADVAIGELPAWWREAVREFREHDLAPYRPPRFADDAFVPPVIKRLEAELGVAVQFKGVGVRHGDAWGVYVGDERALTVDRERDPAGYTRYEVTSEAFERAVRETAGDRDDAASGA